MRTDIHNWVPVSVSEICAIFSEIPVTWCIAGGWALDLYAGMQSREHADVDVIILREEQEAVFRHLSAGWTLYKAENGKLALWGEGEWLAATHDVWVSKDRQSPWAFQLMLIDAVQGTWMYRREKSIRRPLSAIIARTAEGIPYLKPEIQLLYKGGSSNVRDKDDQDFLHFLPMLTPQAREWLKASLQTQFPSGHAWADHIE